jgi:ABC-type lipoprotein release transport system permease subunit
MASDRKGAFGISIVGIEPEKEQPISLLSQHVVSGKYLSASDQDVVFIGKGLADAIDVKVGDRFTLAGSATHGQLRQRTMTVGGIYDVGMGDIERETIYISLAEAQDLYGLPGQSTEVMVSLKQLGQEPTVINALKASLPGYEMDSWQTNYPDLQTAIEDKGAVMDVFGVIILVIAGIGILNLLMMAVYERTREIGLMAALGMRPGQISSLFILEGALLGLIGVAFGVGLGLTFNILLRQYGLDYSQFSSVTQYMALISGKIYPTLGLEKLPQRTLTALIIAVLASFYPAHEAAQNEPAQSLHYV